MKQVSGKLRMELAQYRELASFAQFGSELDESSHRVLERGERMMRVLRQKRYEPLPDWKQALMIYAVSEGFAADVAPADIEEFDARLCDFFERECPDLAAAHATGKRMDGALEGRVKDAIARYKEAR